LQGIIDSLLLVSSICCSGLLTWQMLHSHIPLRGVIAAVLVDDWIIHAGPALQESPIILAHLHSHTSSQGIIDEVLVDDWCNV
jgi:hypothetical protein